MLQRRRFIVAASVLAIVAAACGGSSQSPSGAPAGSQQPGVSSQAPAGSAVAGGSDTLTFVADSEPTTLATEPDDLPTSWIAGFLYTTLYQPNYKLEYVPLAADGMPTITPDGLTWTVKIRQGMTFHDGSPITADDVKFSYDLHLSKNCRGNPDVCSTWADNVKSVDKLDALTVRVTLKQKYAPFISSGLGSTLIVPKKPIEDSFARFQQAAGAVSAADAKTLDDNVKAATATTDEAGKDTQCAGASAPETCKYSTYTKAMEDLLARAGVTLTNKAQYNTGGQSGTDFDPEAYGLGLYTQVHDLALSLAATSLIDQIAQAIKLLDFGDQPVGSGPLKFVKYNAGQNVELARFDNYFGGTTGVDPRKIPAHAFAVVIRDSATATAALGNDEIQWQQKMESDAFTTVRDNPSVQLAEYPDNGYYFVGFNVRSGHIYSDKNLRTAFGMCIDHDKTVDVATSGNGVPVFANIPPFSWAFNADVPKYTTDVAGAKQLIEQSGWTLGDDGIYQKAGKRLSSTLYVRVGRPQRVAFAQLAADQLKQCGIEVKPQEADLNTVLVPKVLNYPNDFETYLGGWNTSLDPDDYSIFHSSEIPTSKNPVANNFPGWKNAQADQLLEQGRQELDQNKRKEIYAQFQTLIREDAPYYFLWADKAHTGLSSRVVSQNQPFDLSSVAINLYNLDAWTINARK